MSDYFPFSSDLSNPDVLAYWRLVGARLAAAPLPDEFDGVGDLVLVFVKDHDALEAARAAALDEASALDDENDPLRASNARDTLELRRALLACGAIAADAPRGTFGGLLPDDDLFDPALAAAAVAGLVEKLVARGTPAGVVAQARALEAGLREFARLDAVADEHAAAADALEVKLGSLRHDFARFHGRFERAVSRHYKKGGRGHEALFGTRGLTLSN